MAEELVIVCDTCGKPAVETVTFRTSSGNRVKDYCAVHLQELLKGSRAPKRGRRPGAAAASVPSTSGARKTSTRKRSTRKRAAAGKKSTTRKKTSARPGFSKNGKRLGRPPASKGRKASTRRTA